MVVPGKEITVALKAPLPWKGIQERDKAMSIRILLADDHAIVRHGLSRAIQQEDDMEVVGQASDGHSTVECPSLVWPTTSMSSSC